MTQRQRITIRWINHDKLPWLKLGMIGEVRAFSLDAVYSRPQLTCHLPGLLGPQAIEAFSNAEDALNRAGEMTREFFERLNVPASAAVDVVPPVPEPEEQAV
ncbi:hypothetical protein [Microbispora bryophytorum]|uniref:hypothetical protein n=1 Tax=Microbispora bryophytorum TaxID=1460882 RepID=UPI0033DC389B